MSGHSKWSTIKHKKAATDAKRGKIFTRLAREIAIAAREGGGDSTVNFRLRLVMDKARAANMPKDNIERAVKRGTGELKSDELEEMLYEGYGPHGIAMLIAVVTDNRNRTVSDVRRIFNKMGGNLAEPGSVVWQFSRKGYITLSAEGLDNDHIFDIAIDANAEDVEFGDDIVEIYSEVDEFQNVQEALDNENIKIENAELSYIPNMQVRLEQKDALKVMNVVDALEELDDVQQVFSNLDISDELMAAYEATQED
jgi:YebC/PmpR family DNA-binding regulatory protein